MGTSLWLVPTDEHAAKLQRVMYTHPPRKDDSLSYPHFHPHITLTTVPSSPDAAQALRESVPPTQYRFLTLFESAEVGDHYFRSVYVAIHPSPEILALHKHISTHVQAALGVEPRSPRFPHMSLYYIDDAEPEERRRIYEELTRNRTIERHGEGGVMLNCNLPGASDADDQLRGFDGYEIWIAECDGAVENWKILERIALR